MDKQAVIGRRSSVSGAGSVLNTENTTVNSEFGGKLARRMWDLYERSELCDLYIISSDGPHIACHSCIIASSSAKLKEQLLKCNIFASWTKFSLFCGGISHTLWKHILHYLYTGVLTVPDHLLALAFDAANYLWLQDFAAVIHEQIKCTNVTESADCAIGPIKVTPHQLELLKQTADSTDGITKNNMWETTTNESLDFSSDFSPFKNDVDDKQLSSRRKMRNPRKVVSEDAIPATTRTRAPAKRSRVISDIRDLECSLSNTPVFGVIKGVYGNAGGLQFSEIKVSNTSTKNTNKSTTNSTKPALSIMASILSSTDCPGSGISTDFGKFQSITTTRSSSVNEISINNAIIPPLYIASGWSTDMNESMTCSRPLYQMSSIKPDPMLMVNTYIGKSFGDIAPIVIQPIEDDQLLNTLEQDVAYQTAAKGTSASSLLGMLASKRNTSPKKLQNPPESSSSSMLLSLLTNNQPSPPTSTKPATVKKASKQKNESLTVLIDDDDEWIFFDDIAVESRTSSKDDPDYTPRKRYKADSAERKSTRRMVKCKGIAVIPRPETSGADTTRLKGSSRSTPTQPTTTQNSVDNLPMPFTSLLLSLATDHDGCRTMSPANAGDSSLGVLNTETSSYKVLKSLLTPTVSMSICTNASSAAPDCTSFRQSTMTPSPSTETSIRSLSNDVDTAVYID